MPEPRPKPHVRRTHSRGHRSSQGKTAPSGYLQPVIYFSCMIVLLVAVKLMHASILSPSTGAAGIVLLAVSKQWKFKPGVIVSVITMFLMVLNLSWQWADRYFISVFSGEILTGPSLFYEGLTANFLVFFLTWVYQRLLNSIHVHGSQRWFAKKTFVVIFRLLLFFLWFLLLFWLTAFAVYNLQPYTHFDGQESSFVAAGIALLGSGIPLIISFSRGISGSRNSHRTGHHRRHREHHREDEPNNLGSV